MKTLVVSSSPRREGNSATLAKEVAYGLREAGHDVKLVFIQDIITSFLDDCRKCRLETGGCSKTDGYEALFFDEVLPSDGWVLATPIYWYGMSAQLKAFFDRMFCYVAASHPASDRVVAQLQRKKIGLVLSSEETFRTVSSGIVHQVQEYCRYTRSDFAGVVHGYGNARGDVYRDPGDPMSKARRFGQGFFSVHTTDFKIDTPRPGAMWRELSDKDQEDPPIAR